MYARMRGIVTALGLLVLMGGCSVIGNCPTRPTNATPDTGTLMTDAVSIATDKSVYAPGDVVHVTFTNHLSTYISVTPKRVSCPLVEMEELQGTTWQDFSVCGPIPSREAPLGPQKVFVSPNQSGLADLTKDNAADQSDHPSFPSGTYRVVLHYETTKPDGAIIGPRDGYTEYSATFRICSCGVCK